MTKIADVSETKIIDNLTFAQYCDDPDKIREDAISSGWKGEAYKYYFLGNGRYTGKTETRHKPLDNGHLYEFAKTKYADTFPHDSPTTLVDANGMSEDDNEKALRESP